MPTKPNIVVILADDLGYGDIGAFGNDAVRTPVLDRLAAEGVYFTQHYSGSAVCAPARASLLSGRYPHRTGAIDTLESRGLDRLSLREVTLADQLKTLGYATGLVGKWHLGALDPRFHPNARGFDEFAGFRGGWIHYWRYRLDYNGSTRPSDGRYATDVFTQEAVDFIDRHRQEPFFLHVAYNAPHYPIEAPDEDVAPFAATGRFSRAVSTLYGMVHRMDRGVGQILEALDRNGLGENTFVLFTSDNGPQMSGSGDDSTVRYNGHFNGSKGTVFEGGLRVPAIARWPAGLNGGSRPVSALIHFTDWYPTLLDVAGASNLVENPINPLDGHDVLPVLRGENTDVDSRRFWQWNRYTPVGSCNAAMRDGPWKLVRPRIAEAMRIDPTHLEIDNSLKEETPLITEIARDPEPERDIPPPPSPLLFNVDEDPYEQEDLSAQYPQRTARMVRDLESWFEAVEAERRRIGDDDR